VRYEKESLLDNYEVPRERRTVLPVLGGIVMIGLFGLWVYMHWTGSLSTEQFIVRGVRRGGAFVVFWWILFLLILVGGVASIKVGIRNWKANRE
jgi:hypothetical protein